MTQFDKMVEFLDKSWNLKDQIVPCLIGPVGIGKTAAVEQHAKNVGAKHVVKIVASQILPNEVSGITMPNDSTRSMDIYDHYRLSSMEDGDILFFDELLEADQSVLKACLTLIESRELMSGKKLPDIQIIAATNPTIMASTLAENIRQRFVFKEFYLKPQEVIDYIKEDTGLDLSRLRGSITCEANSYNILSPRSLTKMSRWGMSIDEDELDSWGAMVNEIWEPLLIGSVIVNAIRASKYQTPEKQVRNAMEEIWYKHRPLVGPELDFENTSFSELEKILTELHIWNVFQEELAKLEIQEANIDLY